MDRSGGDDETKLRPGRPRGRPRGRRRRRLAGAGLSLAVHAGLLAVLLWVAPQAAKIVPPAPAPAVAFLDAPPAPTPSPSPAPPAPSPAPAKAAAAPAPKAPVRTPPRPTRTSRASRPAPVHAEPDDEAGGDPNGVAAELTGADLAGAVSAGAGGGGGGPCDMARRVQAALRKDSLVQSAVAAARLDPGRAQHALLVWNGDWVQSGGEEGKGLSAVREAILWAVGFSPAACRAEPVRGFILFTLSEAPGAPKLALGAHEWRWSDLLGAR